MKQLRLNLELAPVCINGADSKERPFFDQLQSKASPFSRKRFTALAGMERTVPPRQVPARLFSATAYLRATRRPLRDLGFRELVSARLAAFGASRYRP